MIRSSVRKRFAPLAALLAVTSTSSCRSARPSEWNEEVIPGGDFVYGLTGTSDHDIWALGPSSVFHFDGASWSKRVDVTMTRSAAAGVDDVWFGGFQGAVVHWNGTSFETLAVEDATRRHLDVYSIAAWPHEVWVAFDIEGYYRRAAGGWELVTVPELASWKVRDLWGASSTDVWASIERKNGATHEAKLAHRSGASWTLVDHVPGVGFGGSGASDVWVFGTDFTAHWDGRSLTDHRTPAGLRAEINGVAAKSPTDALAVASDGIVLSWDGASWHERQRVGKQDLTAVFSASGSPYRASGTKGVVLRRAVP